ncbi:MAG: ribonuclease III [Chitinophagaceae bacterium]
MRRLFHWLTFRKRNSFTRELTNLLGYHPYSIDLYETALTHRSLGDQTDQNNERLEYLGDAILSALVADYLFKRYPYKGEGYLTEMRSKMVNRQQLNHIALRMGLKKITRYNKSDGSLRLSHIFGNTLEALIGAVYLDIGYKPTEKWVMKNIILPHMFIDELETKEFNHKNKLYAWASRNGAVLEFETLDERVENGRRLFTVAAMLNGESIAEGKAFNKKDASQIAAQAAVDKLGLPPTDPGD